MKKGKNLLKRNWKMLLKLTPNIIKRLFKNRFFIAFTTLVIGGFIGNQADRLTVSALKWLFVKREYYNILFVLLIIISLFCVWIIIAFIRLNDYKKFNSKDDDSSVIRQSSNEFYYELTKIITSSNYKSDLLISIGEGESLNGWLLELFREHKSGRINEPQIRSIHIKMMRPTLCRKLENSKYLSNGFSERMNKNVDDFKRDIREFGVDIKISYWAKLPSFHGFIYDKRCFVNSWEINKERVLHVRTPLKDFSATEHSDKYNSIIEDFEKEY